MSDPKQPAPAPGTFNASSTVSYGAGTLPAVQRPGAPPPPPPPTNTVLAPPNMAAAKGPLSQRTVELVQRSWSQVLPISDAAAGLFYDRLFEMDPSVRPLFKNDMAQQKKKLMQTLGVAVDGLTNPQRLIPVLEQLGVRHAGYMVQDHHYGLVGEALLWTLREGLGDGFTPETESAWKEVYGLVAGVMKKAAASAAKAPAPPQPAVARPPPAPAPPVQSAPPPVPMPAPASVAPPRPAAPPPAPSAPPVAAPSAAVAQPVAPAAKGPLSARTVELVQQSWAQVLPISDAAAGLFYDRLFEMDPSVRPLFKNDMAQQKKKLMQTLGVAVDGLTNPQRLIPVLEQLGARHAGYMVQDHHYDLVGEALLWTLREGLGDGFTLETESAWKEVYGLVASVMRKAAASSAGTRPTVKTPAAPPPSAPPVPEDILVARPATPVQPPTVGDETIPYHMLSQTRLMGLQPYAQPPAPREELTAEVRTVSVPVAAPAAAVPAAVSIPLNVPREVNVNFHLNVKLEADAALSALALRATAPEPPAPKPAPPVRTPPPEPVSAPKGATVSPVLLVALCVLVSVSTVFALGPLGQAASSLNLGDLPRLAAPIFTLAALAVGYLWGRGRGSDRQR
ncbi:globin family protein [Hyalangium gracile]|uniref:globin family protein n=1 Tax=Hyalangium gracile TaxID=394092 RepID=UPI001CC99038|nr:globin family protein [Hyalangium gracile]